MLVPIPDRHRLLHLRFSRINPNAPPLPFLKSIGRSVYNGLQTKLIQNLQRPLRGVRALNFQVSYALSRFDNTGGTFGSGATNSGASDQDSGQILETASQPTRFY